MKRIYTRVRNETFERKIAWYTARKQYEAVDALRSLARDIAAPIDDAVIQTMTEEYRKHLEEIK